MPAPTLLRSRALFVSAVLLLSVMAPAVAHADPTFTVSGRGFGHGIGMTQYGAEGYAVQGRAYDWILAHYFQHTTLEARAEITVRVDLDASKAARSSWLLAATSKTATLTVTDLLNGAHHVDVAHGAAVWMKFKSGGAVLYRDVYDAAKGTHTVGSLLATFPASVYAATGPMVDSMVTLVGTSGPYGASNIGWRGQIRFVPNTTTGHAVNYVPMEQYLRGVVPRESFSSWKAEALKTQAVAARSYAYRGVMDHPDSNLACTTASQVYDGAKHGSSSHETASTDSAVKATANQMVVYDGHVIQTFFSSSSGGRTANIEDVWLGSTPQPYYTSVEDADTKALSGNPNYSWTLAALTGTSLGAKIRDYDNGSDNKDALDYSAPSPATLASVTLDTATSGYVRHVTLLWSNGTSYTILGTKFQSILRLKAPAYSVLVKGTAPVGTRYEDTDARPLWSSAWTTGKSASTSGGSYRRTATAGSTVVITFTGTSISWLGQRSDHAGMADVTLDGTRVATLDLYAKTTAYKAAIWSKTGLSADTTHTLKVTVLGKHRTGSAGSTVYIDAIDVKGTLLASPRPPAWHRYEQNSSTVKYAGTWATSTLPGLSAGTHAWSRTTSSTATFTFTGTRARWVGKRAPSYGKAWVSIDTSAPVLVDLYSSKTLNQQRLFESVLLAPGTHTLRIRVAGTHNSKATNRYVDADAFEALEAVK